MQKLVQCNRRLRSLVTTSLMLVGLIGTCPHVGSAQSLLDPRTAEFSSSPDHNETGKDSLPIVDRYDLSIYESGTGTPLSVVNIGKPSPDGAGVIRLDLVSSLPSWPPPAGVIYEARVTAIGPSGSSLSGFSNTFAFSGPCAYALSTTSATVKAIGGQGSIGVTSGTSCDWLASNATPWITLYSAGGAGTQTVGYSVEPNTSSASRTGSFTIANTLVTVTQAAGVCSFSVSSGNVSFVSSGGSANVAVDAPTGCAWAASSSAPWITVGGTSFSGSDMVGYAVTPNTAATSRTGTLTVAGTVVTVSQAAAAAKCTFTVALSSMTATAGGGSASATVSSPEGCAWTIGSSTPWITVTGSRYAGTQTVSYVVAPNMTLLARSGSVTVSGRTIRILQDAATCSFTTTAGSTAFAAAGGSDTATITTLKGCGWTAASSVPWIKLNVASGVNTRLLTYTVKPNTSASARTGALTIAGTVITITQEVAQGNSH